MKVVILAGGMGTRISEESHLRPKPMIEIGQRPILWHIMKTYSAFGFNDFVICLGYRGYMIKEYFANYGLHASDVTLDLAAGAMTVHQKFVEPWKVTLIDTGPETMTGGRIKRIKPYVDGKPFMMTYGDGVSNVDIRELVRVHEQEKRWATMTAALAPARFGTFTATGTRVDHFLEKPVAENSFINAGFFILGPQIFDLIDGDAAIWEREPMEKLAQAGQLTVHYHKDFWHPMDTLRDKKYLEELWAEGKAPWKVW